MSHEAIISTALRIDPFGADGTLYKLASNSPETLAAFVAAFVADEREACARTCEGISQMASSNAPVLCAMKIRARSRHAALTAPAAEVPEAMGDAEIDAITRAQWGEQIGVMYQAHRACARAVIASRDAQWQSTRLRGGVPEPEPVAVIGSGWQFLWASGDSLESIAKRHGLKIGSKLYTAATQAPAAAAALDAGVVRDAERYRWLREQDNDDFCFAVVKNPHFDVYEPGDELDTAIDAAMSAQAGGGK